MNEDFMSRQDYHHLLNHLKSFKGTAFSKRDITKSVPLFFGHVNIYVDRLVKEGKVIKLGTGLFREVSDN